MVSTEWYFFLVGAGQRFRAPSSARFYGAAQRSVQKRAQALDNVNGADTAPTALQSSTYVGIGLKSR